MGGLPPGTFGLKVLSGREMRPDLWQSGLAVSQLKTKARGPARTARGLAWLSVARGAGLDGFGSTSILPGWVG